MQDDKRHRKLLYITSFLLGMFVIPLLFWIGGYDIPKQRGTDMVLMVIWFLVSGGISFFIAFASKNFESGF